MIEHRTDFLDAISLFFLGPVNTDSAMDVDRKSSQINNLTQLILSLDMEQWENLVEVFHIDKCMIEH